ncbi:MAG: septum formation initiator family protein [Bacteroidia bacterium]|nr:septum formation initiator family protein [Bacteroidia bacterium]
MPPFAHSTHRSQPRLLRMVKNKSRLLILSAVGLALLYFGFSSKGFISRIQVEADLSERKQRVSELERDIEQLRRERDMLRDDFQAIEHVARESHGMIKPGEIVYRILPGDQKPSD